MVKKEGKDRDKERAGRSGVGKEGKKEVEEGIGCRWRAWSGNSTEAIDSPAKGGQMQVLPRALGESSPFSAKKGLEGCWTRSQKFHLMSTLNRI